MKGALAAVILAYAFAPAVSGQAERGRLNKLNVVALDARGQPVTGLNSADFQLFQDGKREDIAFFRFTGGWAIQSRPSPGEYSNRAVPAWHATAILIDLLTNRLMSDSIIGREVADSLKSLESGEGLYLYILTPNGELYPVHPLPQPDTAATPAPEPWTRDVSALMQAAIRKLVGIRPVDDEDIKFRLDLTSKALRDLGAQMAGISGRKNLVWVTHGIPIAGFSISMQTGLDFTNPIRWFCERLAEAQIVVYPVEQSLAGAAAGSPSIQTLQEFANITGGREYSSGLADKAIQQALTDSRANYEIAYYSAVKTDRKHHKIRVACRRKEVRLHTQEGFYALEPLVSPGALAASELQSRRLPMEIETAAHSPFDATGIGLRVRVSPDPVDTHTRRFDVHIHAADLLPRLTREPDAGKVFVAFVAFDESRKPLPHPILVTLTPEQFAAPTRGEIGFREAIPVPQGIRKVRVIVFDAALGAVGSVAIPLSAVTGQLAPRPECIRAA